MITMGEFTDHGNSDSPWKLQSILGQRMQFFEFTSRAIGRSVISNNGLSSSQCNKSGNEGSGYGRSSGIREECSLTPGLTLQQIPPLPKYGINRRLGASLPNIRKNFDGRLRFNYRMHTMSERRKQEDIIERKRHIKWMALVLIDKELARLRDDTAGIMKASLSFTIKFWVTFFDDPPKENALVDALAPTREGASTLYESLAKETGTTVVPTVAPSTVPARPLASTPNIVLT
ncbi:hypothetical protein HAX54_008676 [Datura stramonium]|uniref:Uncharacterized protein n=1 Tax=Datura stramonium TaxID=4076 RepID=A0ABS8TF50_DATST|nr:hypothetical protein [Datura stramonium]